MPTITRVPGDARGRCRIVTANGMVWTVATAPGADVAEQTRASLAILDANLAEARSDKHHIVEAVVYLTDMATKHEMDDVWCDWIPDGAWPNRACVGTALAPGTLVEIKMTALQSA